MVTSPSGPIPKLPSGKAYLAGRASNPAILMKTHCFLDSGDQPFSGRFGRPFAGTSGCKKRNQLSALHPASNPAKFFGQPILCTQVLHVPWIYPGPARTTPGSVPDCDNAPNSPACDRVEISAMLSLHHARKRDGSENVRLQPLRGGPIAALNQRGATDEPDPDWPATPRGRSG